MQFKAKNDKTTWKDTDAAIHDFRSEAPYALERGGHLAGFTLRYAIYGNLSTNNPVVWVLHPLTADHEVATWWPGLIGAGKLYDPAHYTIICANTLGSPHGSTCPLSFDTSGEPYLYTFPLLTYQDMVGAFEALRENLCLTRIHTVIGASIGGQQALEWAVRCPALIERLVIISANARQSPWAIACNESQRMAISLDPTWGKQAEVVLNNGNPQYICAHAKKGSTTDGLNGLKVARSLAILSYRHPAIYEKKYNDLNKWDDFRAARYQAHQGTYFASRFDAYSYWVLSKAMDAHDIGRGRGGIKKILNNITARCLLIGVEEDILFPINDMQFLADYLPHAQLCVLHSVYGHDAFLVETATLSEEIYAFYAAHP